MTQTFETINQNDQRILDFLLFYIFFPMIIISIIVIWIVVGFGWIDWPLGLFLSMFITLIIYSFSIGYRLQSQKLMEFNRDNLSHNLQSIQSNISSSIPHLSQGLLNMKPISKDGS